MHALIQNGTALCSAVTVVRRGTCDQQVAGSNAGRCSVECNPGLAVHIHVSLSPLGTDVSWKGYHRRTGQASQTIVVFPLMGSGPWKGRWAPRLYASLGYDTLYFMASVVLQKMTSRFSDNNEWVCINMTYTIFSRVALANFRLLATVNQSQSARTKLWISDRQVRPPNTFWVNWVNWLTCRFSVFDRWRNSCKNWDLW